MIIFADPARGPVSNWHGRADRRGGPAETRDDVGAALCGRTLVKRGKQGVKLTHRIGRFWHRSKDATRVCNFWLQTRIAGGKIELRVSSRLPAPLSWIAPLTYGQPKERRDSRLVRRVEPPARITIGEMARHFDVSLRTLRFYEDRGLLVPRREGTARYYAPRDKSRLETILHLKQLGFTLTEIREMIADANKKPASGGLKLRPDQVAAQIAHLERQRRDIEGAITELRNVQKTLENA